MSHVIRAYDAVVDDVNKSDRSLVARINTAGVDRYKTVIDPKGASLENYRKNPVVLWEHAKDPRRFTDPIGRNLWVRHNGGQRPTELLAKTRFLDDEFSQQRWEWYRDGTLNAFSVNILPAEQSPPTKDELRSRPEWEPAQLVYRQWDLAEYSGTTVPGNADALVADRAAKLLDLVQRSLLWLPDEVRPVIEAKARTLTESGGLAAGGAAVRGEQRYVRKKDGKWIVYSESGEVLGEHDSEEDARKQLAAIEAHKHAKGKRSGPYVEPDGEHWVVRDADGSLIAGFDSERLARRCLELMEAPRTWRSIHGEMVAEAQVRNAEITAEVDAMLDLLIHGRV